MYRNLQILSFHSIFKIHPHLSQFYIILILQMRNCSPERVSDSQSYSDVRENLNNSIIHLKLVHNSNLVWLLTS
jgi:hypothetical protein